MVEKDKVGRNRKRERNKRAKGGIQCGEITDRKGKKVWQMKKRREEAKYG